MSVATRSALFVLLTLAGCDPAAVTPAPKVETRNTNPSGDRAGLSQCLSDCSGQRLNATDMQTCRNNCETAFKVTATAADSGLDGAMRCMNECHQSKQADVPACMGGCKQAARDADATPADALDRLGTCVDECHADTSLSDTDRWTCLRNCTQTAKVAGAPPT